MTVTSQFESSDATHASCKSCCSGHRPLHAFSSGVILNPSPAPQHVLQRSGLGHRWKSRRTDAPEGLFRQTFEYCYPSSPLLFTFLQACPRCLLGTAWVCWGSKDKQPTKLITTWNIPALSKAQQHGFQNWSAGMRFSLLIQSPWSDGTSLECRA